MFIIKMDREILQNRLKMKIQGLQHDRLCEYGQSSKETKDNIAKEKQDLLQKEQEDILAEKLRKKRQKEREKKKRKKEKLKIKKSQESESEFDK